MTTKRILVTGAEGQVGKTLSLLRDTFKNAELVFLNRQELDITKSAQVQAVFKQYRPHICINTAAYTRVDLAEADSATAFLVNEEGVRNLAEACNSLQAVLIHLSTDYVFDGEKGDAYTEDDVSNPLNVYGMSKRAGELALQNTLETYFILRTSWLYSQFGHNFLKTMLRLAEQQSSIKVVNDQWGTPTYVTDLVLAIGAIVNSNSSAYGLYHLSNQGSATWYEFASAIFGETSHTIELEAVATSEFESKAIRPRFSILDSSKAQRVLGIELPPWKESLKKALAEITKKGK